MMVNYWNLKNKNAGIQKFGKERVESIFNEFVKLIDRYTKGSYQNLYTVDESLFHKSDQRIDFMMNLYEEIIKHANSKLSELENERSRRL